MSDWQTAIKQGLESLGLNPKEEQEEKTSSFNINSYHQLIFEIQNKLKTQYKYEFSVKGFFKDNPLLSSDPDYQKQFEFCMMCVGHVFVKYEDKKTIKHQIELQND